MKQRQHDGHDSLYMMPWYVRDWRASTARALMSAEARGVYRELLDAAWQEGGSLPQDERLLVALAGCTAGEWKRSKAVVLAQFEAGEDGRLRQPRLSWQYERAVTVRSARRAAADAANAKRRGDRDGDRGAKATVTDTVSVGIPEPEPEPENGIRKGGEVEGGVTAAAPPPAPSRLVGLDGTANGNGRQEAHGLLEELAQLGLDPGAELRHASAMPARNGHRERWAADVGELTGRWLAVTLAQLRRRLREAQEEAAVTSRDAQRPAPIDGTAATAWEAVQGRVVGIPEEAWAQWERGLRPVQLSAGSERVELVLEAPSETHVSWIAECHAGPLVAAAAAEGLALRLTHRGVGGGRGLLLQQPQEGARA